MYPRPHARRRLYFCGFAEHKNADCCGKDRGDCRQRPTTRTLKDTFRTRMRRRVLFQLLFPSSGKKRIALNLCSVVFQSSSVVHCFPFISSSFHIFLLPLIIIVINVILIIRLSHFTGMPFALIVFIIIIAQQWHFNSGNTRVEDFISFLLPRN